MIKGNLKVMDMDAHLIPTHEAHLADELALAASRGLILDCATSDVTVYLIRPDGSDGSVEDYDFVFGGHYENNRWVEAKR